MHITVQVMEKFPLFSCSVSVSVPFQCRFFFLSFPLSELRMTSARAFKALVTLVAGRDGVH